MIEAFVLISGAVFWAVFGYGAYALIRTWKTRRQARNA